MRDIGGLLKNEETTSSVVTKLVGTDGKVELLCMN